MNIDKKMQILVLRAKIGLAHAPRTLPHAPTLQNPASCANADTFGLKRILKNLTKAHPTHTLHTDWPIVLQPYWAHVSFGVNLDKLHTQAHHFDWIVFTSANAVYFFSAFIKRYLGLRAASLFERVNVAAIGPQTQRAAQICNFPVHFVPSRHSSHALYRTLPIDRGTRILWPCSALASGNVLRIAGERGLQVLPFVIYTPKVQPLSAHTRALLEGGALDYIVLCSPSVVYSFVMQTAGIYQTQTGFINQRYISPHKAHTAEKQPQIICTGGTTEQAAHKVGLHCTQFNL